METPQSYELAPNELELPVRLCTNIMGIALPVLLTLVLTRDGGSSLLVVGARLLMPVMAFLIVPALLPFVFPELPLPRDGFNIDWLGNCCILSIMTPEKM
jgi:hypothetical protein